MKIENGKLQYEKPPHREAVVIAVLCLAYLGELWFDRPGFAQRMIVTFALLLGYGAAALFRYEKTDWYNVTVRVLDAWRDSVGRVEKAVGVQAMPPPEKDRVAQLRKHFEN